MTATADPAAEPLSPVFQALGHPTRRAVVERLGAGAATVTELAAPFDMALPSFLQHVRLLEASGVVATEKRGRVRTVRLVPSALLAASEWLARQRAVWDARIDRLDAFLQRPESDSKDPR
ncbi:MAG: helix-turn-helix transcriptional regulator [Planctomycetes bacterium]|nr:helix-turn-helix transcriptional regulator [Planctomycetota bacterium]